MHQLLKIFFKLGYENIFKEPLNKEAASCVGIAAIKPSAQI
jgi:hypothetical protein